MTLLRLCLPALFFLAFAAWGQSPSPTPSPDDAKAMQLLEEGQRLVKAKRPADAIPYFDQVAGLYQSRFKDKNVKYYSARTPTEMLLYMAGAALSDKPRSDAVAVSANWGYAYYLKAYALIDLGRVGDAKTELLRATALSPQNAQFLAELGHVYQMEKNWTLAMDMFRRAEKATEFSPDQARDAEQARAWRGIGYVLVELGRLDEAESMYRKCLALNANDAMAQRELAYVLSQKAKSTK
jgi:tetratricopeptide (TPR) repeat protein